MPAMNRVDALLDCHYALGQPKSTAILRHRAEDFQVDEQLGFEPDGEGDHVLLKIKKRGQNTQWLAREIAKLAGIKERDIGYGGLKDRHAVTTQWFSVDVSGRQEADWALLNFESDIAGVQVLLVVRHRRKLRRGTLTGNNFNIVLRDLCGEHEDINTRLEAVRDNGVPNYFGEQRFGGNNVDQAKAMFEQRIRPKRHQRGLYLSAARSFLFNVILSQRIALACWDVAYVGDVMQLAGSQSVFKTTGSEAESDAALSRRLLQQDIHPTGPLWGQGDLMTSARVQELELGLMQEFKPLCEGLERAGLKQQRRSLRLLVKNMRWSFSSNKLTLSFFLAAGSYATVVLREIVNTKR